MEASDVHAAIHSLALYSIVAGEEHLVKLAVAAWLGEHADHILRALPAFDDETAAKTPRALICMLTLLFEYMTVGAKTWLDDGTNAYCAAVVLGVRSDGYVNIRCENGDVVAPAP